MHLSPQSAPQWPTVVIMIMIDFNGDQGLALEESMVLHRWERELLYCLSCKIKQVLLESYALREILQFEPLVITLVFSWALYVSVLSSESVRLELPRYQGNKIDAHS